MKIIGVTGGIASGKSLVSDWFEKALIKVIDADKVYRSLIENNQNMLKDISQTFNLVIKDKQGYDFKALGELVFSNPKELVKLNKITHPYVIESVKRSIEVFRENNEAFIVLDVPLLYEAGMDSLCDQVICVYIKKEVQIDRLVKRSNLTKEDAIKRIESQMDLEVKKEKADFIIDNSFTKDHTYTQFTHVLSNIKSNV